MSRRRRRRGKRNRERKSKRTICYAEWWFGGRKAITVEVDKRGNVWTCVHGDKCRISPSDREWAAHLLKEYLPRLTHDERYAILFG